MQKKYQYIGIIFIILVSVVVIFNKGESQVTNYPAEGELIVAFGDSLLEGVGSSRGNSLPEQISKIINEPIVNLGVSGDTTADGLARIDDVIKLEPKLVILSLGGNDLIRNVPRKEIYSNLESIITEIQKNGAIVVLLGVRGPFKNFDDEYEELSQTHGVPYIENILDGLLGNNEFMSDSIHPNNEGYKIIATRVAQVILELIH